jgi:hypothetical protein
MRRRTLASTREEQEEEGRGGGEGEEEGEGLTGVGAAGGGGAAMPWQPVRGYARAFAGRIDYVVRQ